MDYGPKFDQELEKLLWEFLIRVDQLLPVPNLAQVASVNPVQTTFHTVLLVVSFSLHEHIYNTNMIAVFRRLKPNGGLF